MNLFQAININDMFYKILIDVKTKNRMQIKNSVYGLGIQRLPVSHLIPKRNQHTIN